MSVVRTEISPGTVRAEVPVPGRLGQVWEAITRRDPVSMWFGDLSSDIVPGQDNRLDFGDGDFFTIENVFVNPQAKIEYSWSFLGTGPRNGITWQVVDQGEQCLVIVTDSEPARSEATCLELAEGWTDFLERLERHQRTGEFARYDWRRDFDGCIELPVSPADAARALAPNPGRFLWPPIEAALRGEPITLEALQSNTAILEFQLQDQSWKQPTTCRMEIVARPNDASAIVIRHNGWADISDAPRFCMLERRRFSEKWIAALKEARELVVKAASACVQ